MDHAPARPGAPLSEQDHTLTVDEAAELYARAGHPRTTRRLQKYCARGDLDARKVETSVGERYLITLASIRRHIAQINEAVDASGRVPARPNASERAPKSDKERPGAALPGAPARPGAPQGNDSHLVALLERENSFLRDQVNVKDRQIAELSELYRGTHVLTKGLQQLLAPLIAATDIAKRNPLAPPVGEPSAGSPEGGSGTSRPEPGGSEAEV